MNSKKATRLFLESRRRRGLSDPTVNLYEWVMLKLVEVFPERLPESPEDVRQIFAKNSDLAPSSLQTIWLRLKVFWSWLERENIHDNPTGDLQPPKRLRRFPRVLSRPEILQLLDATDVERDYTILILLLDSGMRVGELASLTRQDIQSNGLTVFGKSGHRIVPVSPEVYHLLRRQGNEEHVWMGKYGRPMSVSGLQQAVRRCMRQAGFVPPKIGPHTLRHTFGVQYIMNDGDVFSLQRILGHRKLETTMLYVEMSNKMVSQQHAKYSPIKHILCCHSADALEAPISHK